MVPLLLIVAAAARTFAEDPAPTPTLTAQSVEWTTSKAKGRRTISAAVLVVDESGQPVSGATVWGTIVFPSGIANGADEPQVTDGSGLATFAVGTRKPPKGTYGLYVNNVTLEGYVFDSVGSVHYSEVEVK
jgi:hypothetical protein